MSSNASILIKKKCKNDHRVIMHPLEKHRTNIRITGNRVIISTNVPLDMKRDNSSIKMLTSNAVGIFLYLQKGV